MKRALADTFLIWVLVGLSIALRALAKVGISLPLFERTTLWRLQSNPHTLIAIAVAGLVVIVALAYGPGEPQRRRRWTALLCVALAVAAYVLFDPGAALAFVFSAATLFRSSKKAQPGPELT